MMKCNLQLSACVVFFLILWLSPDLCGDPTWTSTTGESPLLIRFTPVFLKIHGCEVYLLQSFRTSGEFVLLIHRLQSVWYCLLETLR